MQSASLLFPAGERKGTPATSGAAVTGKLTEAQQKRLAEEAAGNMQTAAARMGMQPAGNPVPVLPTYSQTPFEEEFASHEAPEPLTADALAAAQLQERLHVDTQIDAGHATFDDRTALLQTHRAAWNDLQKKDSDVALSG